MTAPAPSRRRAPARRSTKALTALWILSGAASAFADPGASLGLFEGVDHIALSNSGDAVSSLDVLDGMASDGNQMGSLFAHGSVAGITAAQASPFDDLPQLDSALDVPIRPGAASPNTAITRD